MQSLGKRLTRSISALQLLNQSPRLRLGRFNECPGPCWPLQLRTEHLADLQSPTLILQGERESLGRREEAETYSHSFKHTRSSGLSEAENWATAVALGDQFLRTQEVPACRQSGGQSASTAA